MTEPHYGRSGFIECHDNQTPPSGDAAIYETAALVLEGREIYAAILAAGGTQQHVNYFSRKKCDCRPIQGWVVDEQLTPDMAVKALNDVAEGLRE